MADDTSLEELLSRWQRLQRQGQAPSVEELCAECPQLIDEMKRRLSALASREALLETQDETGVLESHPEPDTRLGRDDRRPPAPKGLPGAIAGYEVLGELGRGGMGVVYKARQVSLKRLVALKMVLAGSHVSQEHRARFRTEAEAVASLQHPNIVQVYEIGEHDGLPYFSMEYVAGDSLARRLAGTPLTATETAELTETLARAIQHAHQRGVIHRDLKPANVLLTEEGTPKITDFGLAKQLQDENLGQTRTGAVLGTPSYMAPEQAEGKTDRIGPLVDVYALGAILYELLSGRPPFQGDSLMGTLNRVIHDDVTPPSRHQPSLDRDLETICLKALAKEPAQRYPSALALAQDLERYRAGEPILARRTSRLRQLWRRIRRSPTAAFSLVAVIVVVAAAAVVWRGASATRQRAVLTQEYEQALAQPELGAARAEELEGLIERMAEGDLDQSAAARRRLHERGAALFRIALRQPRLEPADMARLEDALRWLQARDAELGRALALELSQRQTAWQPRIELTSPWKELQQVFAAGVAVHSDGHGLKGTRATQNLMLTRVASHGPVQIEARFDDWQDTARVGLVLDASAGPGAARQGYHFLLVVHDDNQAADSDGPARKPAKSFRESAGSARMEIVRNGVVLRRQVTALGLGALSLRAKREGDQLLFQVNDGAPLVFFDIVPLRGSAGAVFGLDWPGAAILKELRASAQTLPGAASTLERGDRLYEEARYAEALALYEQQALAAATAAGGREARCKAALCLVQLQRLEEAARLFEPLAVEAEGRWPVVAACQLWLIRLQQKRFEETGVLFESMRARFRPDEIATYVPEDLKQRLLAPEGQLRRVDMLFPTTALRGRLEAVVQMSDLFGDEHARCGARYNLLRVTALLGDEERALPLARETLPLAVQCMRSSPSASGWPIWVGRWFAWLARRQAGAAEALGEFGRYFNDVAKGVQERYPDVPGMKDSFAPLYLERARLHAALGQWKQAESDIDALLRLTPNPVDQFNYFSAAWLMKGFLCQRRGADVEARTAWKQGLYASYLGKRPATALPAPLTTSVDGLVNESILSSLLDELSDVQAEALWNQMVPVFAGESFALQLSATLRPSPKVLRGMWRTPRGLDYARRYAFMDAAPADYSRLPIIAGVTEKFRQDLLDGKTTPAQDEALWLAASTCLDRFSRRQLSQPQLLQIALAWKGTVGFFGWGGVASQLDAELRGPFAYVLGLRYLRLNRRDDALTFFRTALADAGANPSLARLAEEEIKRLQK